MEITGLQSEIAKIQSDVLSQQNTEIYSVGQLEQALLSLFPASDAESWDRTGLLCGDRAATISGVAVCLDATARMVSQARDYGANVLLTHHPAFIDPPEHFGPPTAYATGPESCIYQAIQNNVALLNFHTTLDVSVYAQRILPSMLGLEFQSVLTPLEGQYEKGYGQVCSSKDELTLETLAARCVAVFGHIPRVWGRPATPMQRIVTATGSGGSLLSCCLEQGIDCLVCGELRYHDALAAADAGLSLIELGHDVSEVPLTAVLAASCEQLGLNKSKITVLDHMANWWTPEAIRR